MIHLFQVCFSFRSFQTEFNKEIFQKSCPGYHQYWPDIYPHTCSGVPRECTNTNQLRQIILNNYEVLCHPQIKGYILYWNYDTHILLGWWPYVMIYSYDPNGNLIFTTEGVSLLNRNGCLIGQKYNGIYKCIYCGGYNYGQNCATSPFPRVCGQYCKTCDATNTQCASCIPGQSPLDSDDLKCTLTCEPGHKTCQYIDSIYSFSGCMDGYEFLDQQCVQCPINCQVCSSGICSQCMWPYTLKMSQCFEDRNCMQYDYIYDSNGEPIETDCKQCDVGYFKKGTRCSSCQNEPGLEKCFICHNANECKSCFATHYLTADKKCALSTVGCNSPCQTCLVTDPNYCTTCFYQYKLTARIIPGQCVCDQIEGYAKLNDKCVLCTIGDCQTCTLTFGDCTSCNPLRNRTLIGNTCPCNQGYYDTGLEDRICQQCYPSCYNCSGPYDSDCTDCGDPNIFHKSLVNGKCICAIRTIEIIQDSGSTLCLRKNSIQNLACHTRCEKCQLPADNTSNQYCTMCIAGQNRIVSDDVKCICRSGYGEDGIQDICFKCHYSCLRCNGLLSNNCTECSIEDHRYLTSDNKCLCSPSYYDSGRNEVFCYLSCHHSCVNCLTAGADQCTSCPSTRQPDRIGSTYQCLCKDSDYYSDQSQLECLKCHFSCKTCYGSQNTNCLTCDLNYRQLIQSKCDCPYEYYDVGQLLCQKCHYTCRTCFDSQINNCITCSIQNNRIIKGNLCLCMDGYLEKQIGFQMCIKCSYRCASCSGTINHCDACPDFSFRNLGVDNSCSCPSQYIDQPENPICTACHNTCLTCSGNQSNQCTTCNTSIGRELNNQGECKCASKYFDSGVTECQACSNLCIECITSSTNCTSCQPEKYLNGNTCQCKTKLQGFSVSTYQNLSTCSLCHYSCLSCKGRFSSDCISCWDQDKRTLSGTTCICQPGYFDTGIAKCSQCNFSCLTCAVLNTQCLSCPPQSLRVLKQSQCQCQSGYYSDGINIICQKCHYSCMTCYQLDTKCDTCSTTAKRQFNSILNSCFCNDYYYDKGVDVCEKCHYSCFNCQGQDSNQCTTCVDSNVSFRVYNGGSCQCLIGYYDDGSSVNCKKCFIKCATCQSQSIYCTSCPFTRHLNGNQCDCDSGYYESGQEKCSKCDQSCMNCIINAITCTDCDQSQLRVLNNLTLKCQCQNGTTEINGVCQYCDISCKTCLSTLTNCTSCEIMKKLQNNICICIEGTYEIEINKQCLLCDQKCKTCINQANYCLTCSEENFRIFGFGNVCICKEGYFEDSFFQCIQCHQSCLTCQGNSKFCLSCDPALYLQLNQQNQCICSSNYYFNTSTKKCEACDITCKECQNVSQCIECEPITRYYDGNNFQCLCKQGFYETNQRTCQQCDLTCRTCINLSTKCLTCEPQYFRILKNSNKCFCYDGYFDVGIEMCQKCNDLCKTCQSQSSQCLACYETEQIRILQNNTCICKSGYFDNEQLICEQCSKSCLTCQGKSDYCTSCDVNMNRIDQSAIHKCPCQTNFFQDSNEVCQKCHIKCSGCIQKADKCISCKASNTSNRLTITQNCDCKDGYYDDGIQFQCQRCNYQCKTCIQSSSNCQTCFGNLREGAPACNCKIGFFITEYQTCERNYIEIYLACDNKCSTCEKIPSNCTICKGNRINKSCDCLEGYFEAGQQDCIQCNFQCMTCSGNQSRCLFCRGDRTNLPVCNCQDGFYDDYQSLNCLKCDQYCRTCNLEGCLTCNGNRVLSDEKTCDCPQYSIDHTDTIWCSSCEVAVLDIRFSDDLLSIQILFDFSLNRNYFSSQYQENICLKFLADETIKQLGNNPNCYLDEEDEKQIILELGSNPTIFPGDSIIFLNYSIVHNDCSKKLGQFVFNQVKLPINLIQPIIEYEIPQYLLNPCDDNIILIKSKSQHGLRSMISITWSYLLNGLNGKSNLEDFVLQQTNLQQLDLNIPSQTLPKQSQVTFVVEFQNFIKQKGKQQILVQTHSGQLPTILWQGKKQVYTFEIISLFFKIQKKVCSDQEEIKNGLSQYEVQLVEINKNNSNSRPSRVNVSQTVSDNYFEVKIEQYTLSPYTAYTFKMAVYETQTSFSSSQNITIEVLQGGLQCSFYDTKRLQNYRKDLIINIYCKDLDTQYQWNEDPEIKIDISCADLTKNTFCTNSNNNKIFQVNKTDFVQIVPKQTVKPYSIWGWNVIASKKGRQYFFKYNIVFLENDFKTLDVSYSKGYTIRPINSFETLQFDFNISFEDRQYLLQYQIAIIYNFEVLKILEPQQYSYYFRLFDHYQQFNKGNQFNLKFLAQFTNDILPSQYDLQLNLNQPPICQIRLGSKTIQALQTSKIAANCEIQEDSPFTYQYRFFLNIQDYKDFQKQLTDYSLILNSFQQSNAFEIYLPNSEGVVLIQIMDSKGSITNIESYLNVTEYKLNCSDFVISKLNYKHQIILLLEVLMNHYEQSDCFQFSGNLFKEAMSLIDSEDLFDQLLALQTIKLYKRFIINFNNFNSSKRNLAEIDQKSCYDNNTKRILFNHPKIQIDTSYDILTVKNEFNKIQNFARKMILAKSNLENQIYQDEIFMNELLFQYKQSISNSLDSIMQQIDDMFTKISKISFRTDNDQDQIILITEKLLHLIDDIAIHESAQVEVNGQQFTLNGQQLKYQIAKITKNIFNQQLDIENDLMDSLIVFVQKEQLEIHFNYLNISKKHIQELKLFMNSSQLEIDQQFYSKTKVQNYLYKKQYINYEQLNTNYAIDMTQHFYCNETNLPAYDFQCVQYINNGSLFLCNILIQENNLKQYIQVSCQCQYLGIIFLTRQLIQSENTTETFSFSNISQRNDANCDLHNQPFLLFHGIYIIFSLFMYYELQKLEIQKIIDSIQKQKIIRFYNFHNIFRIYIKSLKVRIKSSYQFIHEIICLFYSEDQIITKSYKFLKLSIFLSILIPLSFFETYFMVKETFTFILITNYLLLLFLRMIFKIFEAIYRFKGKCKSFVIISYLVIHFSSYCLLIYQIKQKQKIIQKQMQPRVQLQYANLNRLHNHIELCIFRPNFNISKNSPLLLYCFNNKNVPIRSIKIIYLFFYLVIQIGSNIFGWN
ncbi:unnamed protein product (macronuclear) [Paramecium tetraurelia]|uniref:EGF-like domain-containing protein n=1 Tax=Paramecium tetraurelia TaxID=5888 RepID=A0C7A8_PARTE|nr:uncharacterized protein GSPATT00035805001 [Paramecium tetraurelia]CAK66675.1 unnamed protein product [Paramecium tetraurelia]|eukprot:XP_001434072.1 hypothetical protein (macronuclear) [Paramecium tetraurelia strain d4-2]